MVLAWLVVACGGDAAHAGNEGPRVDARVAPTEVPRDGAGRHVWSGTITFFDEEQDTLHSLRSELRGSLTTLRTESRFSEPSSWSGEAAFRIVLPPSLGPGPVEATLELVDARGAAGAPVHATLRRL